jgi:hypothetical protein
VDDPKAICGQRVDLAQCIFRIFPITIGSGYEERLSLTENRRQVRSFFEALRAFS